MINPKIMKVGYLTAAVQTPPGTDSQLFINNPREAAITAALKHINFAVENEISTIELGCALAPRDANVPPESMADPVAHHTPIETHKDGRGRDLDAADLNRLVDECKGKVAIGTLGAFENLLHENPAYRQQNIEHIRRAIRTAAKLREAGLKTEGITIFIGRNLNLSIEENMRLFAEVAIPIIRYAKAHGVALFIENCPMCGWSGRDVFTHNIANVPLHWILIARMVEAAGLRGFCYLNHDASHDILQGFRPEWSYKLMKKAGFGWFIRRFHGKDLSRQDGRIAMCGFLGQRVAGVPWDKMNGDQPLPGATYQNPQAIAEGRQVNWFGASVLARTQLELKPEETTFTVEMEQSDFRNPAHFQSQQQHWDIAMSMVLNSIHFMIGIDTAAAAHVTLHHIVQMSHRAGHPRTWSWQPMSPIHESALVGANPIIESAMKWSLPDFSDISDFVLGSDLKAA